jgi:type IV secretion system protein VirB9
MKRHAIPSLAFGAIALIAADTSPSASPSKSIGPDRPTMAARLALPPRIDHADIRAIAGATRKATLAPTPSGFVNAMQVYPYADGVVYRAYASPGQVTDIMLEPGEALGSVASGDTARWVIGDTTSGTGEARRSHILVKPFSAGLVTNLVVLTDRRSYHIILISARTTAMTGLSWTYPQDQLLAIERATKAAAEAAPVAAGLDLTQLHFDYDISGDRPAWRPVRVFDDGRQTYIEFPATIAVGEAPPLFLSGAKGEAQLVNYRLRGHFYVVDRLFDTAELRLGLKHQDIVRIIRVLPTGPRKG